MSKSNQADIKKQDVQKAMQMAKQKAFAAVGLIIVLIIGFIIIKSSLDRADKTEDDESIVISQAFMDENKGLFGNWRR